MKVLNQFLSVYTMLCLSLIIGGSAEVQGQTRNEKVGYFRGYIPIVYDNEDNAHVLYAAEVYFADKEESTTESLGSSFFPHEDYETLKRGAKKTIQWHPPLLYHFQRLTFGQTGKTFEAEKFITDFNEVIRQKYGFNLLDLTSFNPEEDQDMSSYSYRYNTNGTKAFLYSFMGQENFEGSIQKIRAGYCQGGKVVFDKHADGSLSDTLDDLHNLKIKENRVYVIAYKQDQNILKNGYTPNPNYCDSDFAEFFFGKASKGLAKD